MTFGGANYPAILLAAVAAWIAGAVWYGVFGRSWLKATGRTREEIERTRGTPAFYLPFVIAFLANLLMAWALAGVIGHLGPGQVTLRNGMISAFVVWLGFVATTISVNYAFAGRPPMLTAIDCGHWLAALLVAGAVIGAIGV